VAILKVDTDLFTTTDEADKIRNITVGYPEGKIDDGSMFPLIYITNSISNFESITNLGSIVADMHTALQHTFHYDFTIVVTEKTAAQAEKKLDDYQELLEESIESDLQLIGVSTQEVDMSYPVSVSHLEIGKLGEGKKGRTITWRFVKTTGA